MLTIKEKYGHFAQLSEIIVLKCSSSQNGQQDIEYHQGIHEDQDKIEVL